MRRRLWWQIIAVDGFAAEHCGAGSSSLGVNWDMKLPLNVNDSELSPDMSEGPLERNGITDMSFCRLRYTVGQFLRKSSLKRVFYGSWQSLSEQKSSLEDKFKGINEVERSLEDGFFRYCDNSIPFHNFIWIVGQCCLSMMRLRAYTLAERLTDAPPATLDKQHMFSAAVQVLQYDNLLKSSQGIRRYYWHVDVHFQWYAFMYLLQALQKHTIGEDVNGAWAEIMSVYSNRPRILSDRKNALVRASSAVALERGKRESRHSGTILRIMQR